MKMPVPLAFKACLSRRWSQTLDSMEPQSSLVLAQVIFRHGHRSPDQSVNYPGDPYEHELYLPYGKGELTLKGRKQSYAFGQFLRQRYGSFLGPEYYHGLIDARASEVSRARTTLQLVLAGLFPPSKSSQIDDNLNWQPVPFSYTPLKQDMLIAKAILNMYHHEDHPDFGKSQNSIEVAKCIEENLNWPVNKQGQCVLILDTVRSQIEYGLPMPQWCSEIYPHKLQIESNSFMKHNFGQKSFLIRGHGAIIKHISDTMRQKVQEVEDISDKVKQTPKLYLYSGHDVNVAGILGILDHFQHRDWPNYLSNIILELHVIDNEFYVKIFYFHGASEELTKESFDKSLEVLKLSNSDDELCKLDVFEEVVQLFFPPPA